MSNLQNDVLEEKLKKDFEEAYIESEKARLMCLKENLRESFEYAFSSDEQLRNFLAYQELSGFDFYGYVFCGEKYLLDKEKDEIFWFIKEAFYAYKGNKFTIRELCERAYGMEIEREPREDY